METTPQIPLSLIRDYPTKSAVESALQSGYTPQQIIHPLKYRLGEFVLWFNERAYHYQERAREHSLKWIFLTEEQIKKFMECNAMYKQLAKEARDDISILQKDGLEAWLLTQPSS